MNILPCHPRRFPRLLRSCSFGLLLVAQCGCTFFHNYGTGTHLDAPPEKVAHHGNARASTMQVEVTTDAAGQVALVHFVKSSGSDAVDGFVADNIRHSWPGEPSKRSLVEIHYAPGTGFSEPKLLSSGPAS